MSAEDALNRAEVLLGRLEVARTRLEARSGQRADRSRVDHHCSTAELAPSAASGGRRNEDRRGRCNGRNGEKGGVGWAWGDCTRNSERHYDARLRRTSDCLKSNCICKFSYDVR